MQIRRIDIYGKPSLNPEKKKETWEIFPGRYFIKKVGIANGMPLWFQHHKGVDPERIDAPYTVEFAVGDRVRCRETGKSWAFGVVESTAPLKVKVDGVGKAYKWDEVEKAE